MGAHLRQQLKDLTAQLEVANEKVSQLEAANEKVSQLEAANEKVSQLEAANEKVSQLEAANEKLCQLLSANAVDVEVASTQDDVRTMACILATLSLLAPFSKCPRQCFCL